MVGPAAKREAVAHLRTQFEMSERRATTLVGADRTMIRYRPRRPDDAALRARLRDLAHQRHRFGYRRLHVLLRRDGEAASRNKVYRLYRARGPGGAKAQGTGVAPWASGAPARACAAGERALVARLRARPARLRGGASGSSTWSTTQPASACSRSPDTSISGKRVVRELTALVARRGRPQMIVSDNGTEFTSNAVLAWCQTEGVAWHYIAHGQADAERLLRELQRPYARRTPERDAVPRPSPCPSEARELGRRLQHRAASLGARLSYTGGASRPPHRNGRSAAQPRPAPPIARCSIRARRAYQTDRL